MKKVFNSLFVIIAAMVTFAGCAKQEIDAPATPETKTVQFFANSIETKTAFGTPNGTTYPTLWNVGDKVKVLLNIEQVGGTEKIAEVECEADLAESARFEVAFEPKTTPESYTYYAVCPSSAYNAKSSTDGRITVIIPTDQTPLETTVDKDAQIIYAVAPADADQTSVDMDFHHFTAYGKLSFKNIASSSVSKVQFIAPETLYISGKWNYLVQDGSIAVHTKDMSNVITINTTQTENIWFSCGPVDVSEQTFKIVVTTEEGDLIKDITFPKDCKFEAGRIANFIVDMTDIEVEGTDEPEQPGETTEAWTLVTDASTLVVGDQITIAAAEEDYAIGTQNNNNRASVAITKSNNNITINDNVQIITLEAGNKANTFAFSTGSGYLYAASSSSNHLKTKTDLDDDGSWNITIAEGVATIKAQGTNTKNWLRFNTSNSPKLFSCYSSGQKDVAIYRLESGNDDGEGGETPVEKMLESIAVSDAKTEYTVRDEFEKPTVTATYSDGSTEDVTASAEFTGYEMSAAGTYTVTVSYFGKTVTYQITVAAATDGGDEGDDTTGGTHYVKVTSTPADWSGDYLIVYEDGKVAFDGSRTTLDVVSNTKDVSIVDGKIEATDAMKASQFTIDAAGNVKSASGYYVGQTSDANGLKSSQSIKYANTISLNTDGSVNMVSGDAYLRYNATSGQYRFRYYKSSSYTGQKAIHLYKLN